LANKNDADNIFLVSVYSNPASKSTTISFSLQQSENISINIFDVTGQLVKTFVDQIFEKGEHSLEWNTVGIHEGVYSVQLQSSTISQMEKLVVTK
jgi:flagellar hook assembly protein FlgD